MSIVFEKDGLSVKISRDGEISFPGYDKQLQHDIAVAAMGGEKTLAVILLNRWEFRPAEIMCHQIKLPRDVFVGLAADWAEHVLPAFGGSRLSDYSPSPRMLIDFARSFVAASEEERAGFSMSICRNASRVASGVGGFPKKAARAAWFAARCVCEGGSLTAKNAKNAATHAEGAVEDKYVERAWQIRRFVDVLEALKTGKPWPLLEATK